MFLYYSHISHKTQFFYSIRWWGESYSLRALKRKDLLLNYDIVINIGCSKSLELTIFENGNSLDLYRLVIIIWSMKRYDIKESTIIITWLVKECNHSLVIAAIPINFETFVVCFCSVVRVKCVFITLLKTNYPLLVS